MKRPARKVQPGSILVTVALLLATTAVSSAAAAQGLPAYLDRQPNAQPLVIDDRNMLESTRSGKTASDNQRTEWTNEDPGACVPSSTSAHVAGELAQLATPPPCDFVPALITFIAHLGLKHCTPVVVPPPEIAANEPDAIPSSNFRQIEVYGVSSTFENGTFGDFSEVRGR